MEPESEEKPQKSLNEKQQVSGYLDVFTKLHPLKMPNPYLISLLFQAKWKKDVYYLFTLPVPLNLFAYTGEPGPPNKVYHSRFGIFWWQTSCGMCHLQMPSPLEVI